MLCIKFPRITLFLYPTFYYRSGQQHLPYAFCPGSKDEKMDNKSIFPPDPYKQFMSLSASWSIMINVVDNFFVIFLFFHTFKKIFFIEFLLKCQKMVLKVLYI